jgi:hypothetical protein
MSFGGARFPGAFACGSVRCCGYRAALQTPAAAWQEELMRRLVFAVLLGAAVIAAHMMAVRAQDAIPNLKGTWTGKGNAIVFGHNAHHPGPQTDRDPPRVHEIEAKYVVDGQDGRLAWGRSSSAVADTEEPFAWAIASDNKTILGADEDGYFHIMLVTPDRIEKCYTQNGTSPSHAIVAACYTMDRTKP